jgi:predicted ribosomally synthesized peptide with nif11-like leader
MNFAGRWGSRESTSNILAKPFDEEARPFIHKKWTPPAMELICRQTQPLTMSTENIRSFFERAKDSPELQRKVEAISGATAQSTAEALAALSQESEFPFTAEEFLIASRPAQGELSDEDMAAVAGGGLWDFITGIFGDKMADDSTPRSGHRRR